MKIYIAEDIDDRFNVYEYCYRFKYRVFGVRLCYMTRKEFKDLCEKEVVLNYHITPKGYLIKNRIIESELAKKEKSKLEEDLLNLSNRLGIKGKLFDISLDESAKLCEKFRIEGYTEDRLLCSKGIEMNNIIVRLYRNIDGVLSCIINLKDEKLVIGKNCMFMGEMLELSEYRGLYEWLNKKIQIA